MFLFFPTLVSTSFGILLPPLRFDIARYAFNVEPLQSAQNKY